MIKWGQCAHNLCFGEQNVATATILVGGTRKEDSAESTLEEL